MSYAAFASPEHATAVSADMPTRKDQLGKHALQRRRDLSKPAHAWELVFPGREENLDAMIGLLNYSQGDTPLWFDGAGVNAEVVEPRLIGIGNGARRDFELLHRHAYAATVVIYLNGSLTQFWQPLGDGVTCGAIRFDYAPDAQYIITAKYRAKFKVVLETDEDFKIERSFHSPTPGQGVERIRYVLRESVI